MNSEIEEFKLSEYYEIGEKFIHSKVSDYISEKDGVKIFRVGEDPRVFKLVEYEQYKEPWWIEPFRFLLCDSFKIDRWVVVINFDINKLFSAKMNMESMANLITKSFGKSRHDKNIVTCAYSPTVLHQIHMFIDFDDIYDYVKTSMKKNTQNDSSSADLKTPEAVLFYNVRDVFIPELKNIIVRGVPGINKIFVKKDPLKTTMFKIDTQGVNLNDVLARTYGTPEVDLERTICDDMHEIFNTLGIEAVRSFLIYEINRVLSFDGTYINIRHISLLVDLMLRKGIITSVDRNGMGKDAGPLAAAMFEQTVKIITSCAANTEVDSMQSISSAVMLGKLSQIGSNTVKVVPRDRKPIL